MSDDSERPIIVRQRPEGDWVCYIGGPDGKTTTLDPILASNIATDAAIAKWEELWGRKVPSEFGFSKIPYVETIGLRR